MPRIAVVYSSVDPVGVNLARLMREAYGVDACPEPGCKLVEVDRDTPFLDDLHERLPGFDGYVIVSRHESRSGRPTLSVHHTGNPGDEVFGGEARSLEWAWPRLAAQLLRTYRRVAEKLGLTSRYHVTLEATHHGPTRVPKPVVFIEIGSTEAEWSDERALRALAETLWETVLSSVELAECSVVASGFGDTHYPVLHTRLVLEEGYCYAHIISKHALRGLDEGVARQAVEKSVDRVERLVLAKIPGAVRRMLERLAGDLGVGVERRG